MRQSYRPIIPPPQSLVLQRRPLTWQWRWPRAPGGRRARRHRLVQQQLVRRRQRLVPGRRRRPEGVDSVGCGCRREGGGRARAIKRARGMCIGRGPLAPGHSVERKGERGLACIIWPEDLGVVGALVVLFWSTWSAVIKPHIQRAGELRRAHPAGQMIGIFFSFFARATTLECLAVLAAPGVA